MNTFNLIAVGECAGAVSTCLMPPSPSLYVACPFCIPSINVIQYHILMLHHRGLSEQPSFSNPAWARRVNTKNTSSGARVALPQLVGGSSESTSLDANHRQ